MRRLIRAILCKLGRHTWKQHELPVSGVLTIVRRCDCGRVDIDSIRQTVWNRAARRRWSRAVGVRRRLRRTA